MKNSFYLFLLILAIGVSTSCEDGNFLDETVTTDLDIDVVFSDSTYTVGFLSEIYRDTDFDTDPGRFSDAYNRYGGLQNACDETEYRASSTITSDVMFARGTVNPVVISADAWEKTYRNIRRVNVFLENVDRSPLSDGLKKTYKAEARFLRAWYYHILVKHYGGVPLIGDVVYQDQEEIKPIRDTFADCINYIVSECDAVAPDLIVKPTGRNYGRVGAGACRALKSRMLLYAASKLYNGSDYAPEGFQKELLGYPTYDKERWKTAMDAALSVIQLNAYSLYVDNDDESGRAYYRIFVAADWASEGSTKGTIFEYQRQKGFHHQQLFNPPSRGGGGGGYPYQDLVDAYPMKDGSKFDWNNPMHTANPYLNRDPRFKNTIVHDQTPVQDGGTENVPVNIYLNENGTPSSQDAVYTGTPTGYYICKLTHRATAANWVAAPTQARPLMRYAEILLNFAEAANEYSGPSQEIYDCLTAIRERAGIVDAVGNGLYGLKANMNQDEMRQAIRDERRIELAIEGFRFWDVRRWMIAEETAAKTMTGLEVRRVGNTKTYTKFDIRPQVFRKAMYFWPIPNSEITKSPDLIQNPYY